MQGATKCAVKGAHFVAGDTTNCAGVTKCAVTISMYNQLNPDHWNLKNTATLNTCETDQYKHSLFD